MNYAARARLALIENYPDPVDEPGVDSLLDLYTVLVLTKGEDTTLADVHDCWSLYTDRGRPQHESLIPFEELTEEIQAYDRPYLDAIQMAAAQLKEAV